MKLSEAEQKIRIRKNGKYWQLGYYEQGRWVFLKQLGTGADLYKTLQRTPPKHIPNNAVKKFIEMWENTPKEQETEKP